MKILQLDVENITYELIKPEAKVYEESGEKSVSVDDTVALLVSVEKGDTAETGKKAVADTISFIGKQKLKRLLIYPFAHLSNNLAAPEDAIKIFDSMYKEALNSKEIEVRKAPFGWNKKLTLSVKGYPLAEQSRNYGITGAEEKAYVKTKPISLNTSIIKKSDWSGLPETDHRTIGEKLDLYSFQEVSPGMTFWHPNGHIIFRELFKYIREKLEEYGYQEIATPAFANMALWRVSGHYDHYKDDMFVFEADGQQYGLKPMNCPSTIMIYKSRKWSYRDMPLRFADFDKLYRNELSGVLTGLVRLREFTQDDAHLFVREDQIEVEITSILKMISELYGKFGLSYKAKLSTMPDSHLGSEELWEKAKQNLINALNANNTIFETKEKEGAFYGPKIDFDVKDSMGRDWQCATVQLDYQLPQRFNLEYTGEDGKQHAPVLIHRVIYGSLERFLAVLTEHCQGRFPTWISPVQAKVLSISEQTNKYAETVFESIKKGGIRVEIDVSDRTLDYKLREGLSAKIPYIIILGKKEEESKKVAVRIRDGTQKFGVGLDDFIATIKREISERSGTLSSDFKSP